MAFGRIFEAAFTALALTAFLKTPDPAASAPP
jgi:hypothetical protein